MLYYSDGGSGSATKLLRVDAPEDASMEQWRSSPAASWQPHSGWVPNTFVQLDILGTGDFGMVDGSQVATIQAEMRASLAKYE